MVKSSAVSVAISLPSLLKVCPRIVGICLITPNAAGCSSLLHCLLLCVAAGCSSRSPPLFAVVHHCRLQFSPPLFAVVHHCRLQFSPLLFAVFTDCEVTTVWCRWFVCRCGHGVVGGPQVCIWGLWAGSCKMATWPGSAAECWLAFLPC